MGECDFTFVVSGQPVAKERPRLGRGGRVYTPEKTRSYERLVSREARIALPDGWTATKDDRYRIEVTFYMGDRRQRDGDNMLKAVQDALQLLDSGPVWLDDKLCVEGEYRVRYDKANPRAEVRVIRLKGYMSGESVVKTTRCAACIALAQTA